MTGRRIQAWIDADDAAPRTVRHHHAVLRRALNIAVRQFYGSGRSGVL